MRHFGFIILTHSVLCYIYETFFFAVTVVNEAVISKAKKSDNIQQEVTKSDKNTVKNVSSSKKVVANANNASKKVTKKVIDDPIFTNFTVEGWPASKSRIATDYIDYKSDTAILKPTEVFSSPLASKIIK